MIPVHRIASPIFASWAAVALLAVSPALAQSPVDHFKCYEARGTAPPRNVLLQNVVTNALYGSVATLEELCVPVDKNGSGINNPVAHLTCYGLRTPSAFPPGVFITITTDQFGLEITQVDASDQICLPAFKNNEGCVRRRNGLVTCPLDQLQSTLNHYECLPSPDVLFRDFVLPLSVDLVDQFESEGFEATETSNVCLPLRFKTFERPPVPFPSTGLRCYDIVDLDPPPFSGATVTTQDQWFRQRVRVGTPTRLCNPTF